MSLLPKSGLWDKLVWPWRPESNREAGSAVVSNFLLHWFPNRVTLRSLAVGYSYYLGTITFALLLILTLTGVVLMFLYVPSVERAYWSIKDIDFAVSFGWLLRRMHRLAAHLMVIFVFLHMIRVFLTGSYKRGSAVGSQRPLNWVLGVVLLVLTLLLSFTGYLLPWDQLAFWAITVGTGIAASIPLAGESMRQLLLGGTIISQSTLIRFYVLHVAFLPLLLFAIAAWHMWRIRKDGGLAVVEQVRNEAQTRPPQLPKKSKTYSILGIATGATVYVNDPTLLDEKNSVPSSPHLTMRLLHVILLTTLVVMIMALFISAPLEEPANPELTPNPAKAPWYFLGLQEMVGYSALFGGVIIPLLVILGLALIPFIDREQNRIGLWFTDAAGRLWAAWGAIWGAVCTAAALFLAVNFPGREILPGIAGQLFFDLINPASFLLAAIAVLYFVALKAAQSRRTASIAVFAAFIISFVLLTYAGTVLRGPNWAFYWPWEAWPSHPIQF